MNEDDIEKISYLDLYEILDISKESYDKNLASFRDRDNLYLVPPNDVQALDLETLSRSPLIFRETGSSTQHCLEASAKKHAIKLRPVITVEGRQALCEVVASGAGIGFVSLAELGNLSDICSVPIEGVALEMKEKVVFLSARRDLPMIRAFVRGLRADDLQSV